MASHFTRIWIQIGREIKMALELADKGEGLRNTARGTRRERSERVVRELAEYCASLAVGDRIPPHADLLARFGTSERVMLKALAEMQRRGSIVRRVGAGTYIADPNAVRGKDLPVPAKAMSLVIVGSHDNAYWTRAIDEAFKAAEELGVAVSYEPANNERVLVTARERLPSNAGYLVLGSGSLAMAGALEADGRRVMMLGDPGLRGPFPFPCVHCDNMMGGYLAAQHLIGLGHRRIAYVRSDNNPRVWGHNQAVSDAKGSGLDVQSVTFDGDVVDGWMADWAKARRIFDAPDGPTGLCVWNDTDAINLLTFLSRLGKRVPEDISLVGYDNLPLSGTVTPGLTTVETRLMDQVRLAVAAIAVVRDEPVHSILVQPELVVRQSTRAISA